MKSPTHLRRACFVIAATVAAAGLAGCAAEQDRAPLHPTQSTPPTVLCDHPSVAGDLQEDSVGVSTRPPIRRAPPQFDDADADAVRLFHDVLAPYGTWTDDSRLGLVWIPSQDSVSKSFVPYGTDGRWTYREVVAVMPNGTAPYHEYIWVSDLPWGWVTFHYGRWAFTGERGWAWVAGRRYAGAWVDWRAPAGGSKDAIVGWGPTPPAHVWRVSPGPRPTRARIETALDPRDARLIPIPYSAFATPYTYARAHDLFATDLGARLMPMASALAVAHGTEPSTAPAPEQLGFRSGEAPSPPMLDRGLQQAWMLATPATASAIGAGPELGPPPRLRTWVAGGPRYAVMR